ncbi:hypothetical protein HMPREF0742_01593 [Rothia aeria F0184]|uniref:Uncharacterized protein n=1 Tax=Rothia aeria F0184 TaxID=888019 RepID=U7V4W6_9MICC|nr:hypothetical protein HMPREF0742_01593 [Rothia aeria F0184]
MEPSRRCVLKNIRKHSLNFTKYIHSAGACPIIVYRFSFIGSHNNRSA